jgi:hypothetical protein
MTSPGDKLDGFQSKQEPSPSPQRGLSQVWAFAVTILGVLTAIILFAAELRHYATPHEIQTVKLHKLVLSLATVCVTVVHSLTDDDLRTADGSGHEQEHVSSRSLQHDIPCLALPWYGPAIALKFVSRPLHSNCPCPIELGNRDLIHICYDLHIATHTCHVSFTSPTSQLVRNTLSPAGTVHVHLHMKHISASLPCRSVAS